MLKTRTKDKEEKNMMKLISAVLSGTLILISLAFYMAKEGDIAGAQQIINIIPGFVTNTFWIIIVLMFLAIFNGIIYGIRNIISKFF